MSRALLLLLVLTCGACASRAPLAGGSSPIAWSTLGGLEDADAADAEDAEPSHGLGHRLLLYIPNRIFDVLDIVRLRLRVGPGIAVGVRATELVDVYAGSYGALYVGLPGPRGRRIPVLPFGFENRTGVEASLVDATVEGGLGPDYGLAEVGLGLQLFILGFDVGVDVFEIGDLAVGLLTFDPMDDDL